MPEMTNKEAAKACQGILDNNGAKLAELRLFHGNPGSVLEKMRREDIAKHEKIGAALRLAVKALEKEDCQHARHGICTKDNCACECPHHWRDNHA